MEKEKCKFYKKQFLSNYCELFKSSCYDKYCNFYNEFIKLNQLEKKIQLINNSTILITQDVKGGSLLKIYFDENTNNIILKNTNGEIVATQTKKL